MEQQQGYIYLLQAIGTNRFKIGKTAGNPYKRLSSIQTTSPYKLELLGVIETDHIDAKEEEVQQCFAPYRIQGEWFEFPAAILQQVLELFDPQPLSKLRERKPPQRRPRPYPVECWSERSHRGKWDQCWEQFSIYAGGELAAKTGWIQEYRYYWNTPYGIGMAGEFCFMCLLVMQMGERKAFERGIGHYFFEPSEPGETMADPLDFARSRTRVKVQRITEKIHSGEHYRETLRYLGATYLFKKIKLDEADQEGKGKDWRDRADIAAPFVTPSADNIRWNFLFPDVEEYLQQFRSS